MQDWFTGVAWHILVLVASGLVAAGVVVFGLLMTVRFEPRPTSRQRLGADLVVVAAAIVVVAPQLVLLRARSHDRPGRGAAVISAAVIAVVLVVGGLTMVIRVALDRRAARAAASDHREVVGTGVVLYRPKRLPQSFTRQDVRAQGGGVTITYSPKPTAPNYPAYHLREDPLDAADPSFSCLYGEGVGTTPSYRCRAVDLMPTGEWVYEVEYPVANEAILTARFPSTVVTLTAVWDAASDRSLMRQTMRSLQRGSPA